MANKTYTAQSVGKNHNWDYSADDAGNITGLRISAEVNYGEMGITESKDIWPSLTPAWKTKIQTAYDLGGTWFDNHFID